MNSSMSKIGCLLENYKLWYLAQAKLIKIFFLPFVLSVFLIYTRTNTGEKAGSSSFLIIILFLLAWHLYNQYLDSWEKDSVAVIEKEKEGLVDLVGRMTHLNKVLKNLVEKKLELFQETIDIAEDNMDDAISHIRDTNTFKHNLDRIVAMVHQVFDKYSDSKSDQKFGVTFLAPDGESNKLVVKSWYNDDSASPVPCDHGDFDVVKGGKSLAGYLWDSEKSEVIIDDTHDYVKKNDGRVDSIFSFFNEAQKESIKSIYCYKVEDAKDYSFLGVLCIESNVPNAFNGHKKFYKSMLESFGKRVIFEARFSAMKDRLQSELNEGSAA